MLRVVNAINTREDTKDAVAAMFIRVDAGQSDDDDAWIVSTLASFSGSTLFRTLSQPPISASSARRDPRDLPGGSFIGRENGNSDGNGAICRFTSTPLTRPR